MLAQHMVLFRIGTLAVAFCAILNAQPGTSSKFPTPHNAATASCTGCVRDLNGRISQNPIPVRAFRATHPCPATKSAQGPCPGFVVDHKKPLNRGGANTPENMRWRKVPNLK
jgi:hypothetical protein